MSSAFGDSQGKRKRITGRLDLGPRGHNLLTDAGDLWVLERDDIDPDLIGLRVTAEGTLSGLDRLRVEWIGQSAE